MQTNLDNMDLMARLDPSNMVGAVERFPDPFLSRTKGIGVELKTSVSGLRTLVLMGMGGSASAGDVVADWLRGDLRIPICVHREPRLPGFVNSKTLFVAVSYSGETSETLTAFRAAKMRRAQLIGVGTGGKLEGLCDQFRAPFIEVETTVAPRAALSQMIVAIATALESLGLSRSTSKVLPEAGKELARLRTRFKAQNPIEKNPAKRLAAKLLGRFIVMYSLERMSSVARRFKNQLGENCKEVAKYDVLPEACHNEIEAWGNYPKGSLPILIRDSKESEFEQSTADAFRSTISSASNAHSIEVRVPCLGNLSRLVCPIFFLDYVSVYLALLNRINPTPTQSIAKYKTIMKSR